MALLGILLLSVAVVAAIVFRRRWPRTWLVGALVVLLVAAGGLLWASDRVDRCLDRGGRWNPVTSRCEGCPGCPPVTPDQSPSSTASPTSGIHERPDTLLEARLRKLVDALPARVSIAARHLGNGSVARVNADTRVPLMSVVKVPVALVVLDGVDRGRWPLDTAITLLPGDMHPRGWLGDRYPRGGGPVRLHLLLQEMLTRSDNSSTDALMRLVGGPAAITRWLVDHGIRDLRVDRTERGLGNDWYGLPPGADTMGTAEEIREQRSLLSDDAHDRAMAAMLTDPRDTGSAAACLRMLEGLWRGELLSAAMTDTLKDMLGRCRTAPRRLPAMLPNGTPVARKTGTGGTWRGITVAINDIGVVRLPDGSDVVIAVLVGEPRGSVHRAERLIARTAREVFDAWSETPSEPLVNR